MATLSCTPIQTLPELYEWLDFSKALYPSPHYVPPVRQNIIDLFQDKSPYLKDGPISFVVVKDDRGKVVGRTTIHQSAKFDKKLKQKVQLFGYTDIIEDYEVFQCLFDYITTAARKSGKEILFGPANLLPNQSGGVITSGFDQRSFVDNAYNHPYYPVFYNRYGFAEMFNADTYICHDLSNLSLQPEKIFPFDKARIPAEKLEIHYGSRRKFSKQIPILQAMLNDSFSTLAYYTEISLEELRYQVQGLDFLLEEKLLSYLTKADKPVAFILCIPDISEYVIKIGGNLHLWNQIKLYLQRKQYRKEAILIIKGTVPTEWGQGYMRLLSQELLKNMRTLGYHTLRTTWIGKDNPGSASQFTKMNGAVLNGLTFYRKQI